MFLRVVIRYQNQPNNVENPDFTHQTLSNLPHKIATDNRNDHQVPCFKLKIGKSKSMAITSAMSFSIIEQPFLKEKILHTHKYWRPREVENQAKHNDITWRTSEIVYVCVASNNKNSILIESTIGEQRIHIASASITQTGDNQKWNEISVGDWAKIVVCVVIRFDMSMTFGWVYASSSWWCSSTWAVPIHTKCQLV